MSNRLKLHIVVVILGYYMYYEREGRSWKEAKHLTRLTRRAGLRRSRPWYELKRDTGPSPGLRGENGTFSEKVTKTGSGGITPVGTISQCFRHFQGFLKIQVEMTRAGKGGVPGAYAPRKNH